MRGLPLLALSAAVVLWIGGCGGTTSSAAPVTTSFLHEGHPPAVDSEASPSETELRDSRPTSTRSFSQAKKVGWELFADAPVSFYCGCPYSQPDPDLAAVPDLEACQFDAHGSYAARAARIEWEHIVPASRMGGDRSCWTQTDCVRPSSGSSLRGRDCCEATDSEFAMMHSDLHNLVPAVGQINAVRSDHEYGEVEGEERRWGACDFEDASGVSEPPPSRRGDVARAYLYMELVYAMELTPAEQRRFAAWHIDDAPDEAERQWNQSVAVIQGNLNPFIE